MRTIGVRDAKARLSRLLRDVQRGGEWVITDRGRPVARLVPLAGPGVDPQHELNRLIDLGAVEEGLPRTTALPLPVDIPDGLAQRYLREDRDARG